MVSQRLNISNGLLVKILPYNTIYLVIDNLAMAGLSVYLLKQMPKCKPHLSATSNKVVISYYKCSKCLRHVKRLQ